MKCRLLGILIILSAIVMFGCTGKNTEKQESFLGKFMTEDGYDMDLSLFECKSGTVKIMTVGDIIEKEAEILWKPF